MTVCEQAAQVGGQIGRFERDGFGFDTGPSVLTLPAVYRDLFLKTGGPLEGEVELVPVDPACHYRFSDGTELDLPNASRAGVSRALAQALGGDAGEQWAAFMDRAALIWDASRATFLEAPLDGARTLLNASRRGRDVRTIAPWTTLRGLGRQYLRDPRLRTLLDRYATYTGSDPRRAPATVATVPYVEQTFGSWHVAGGLRRLADALLQRLEALQVSVRTSTEVDRVLIEGGRAAGVVLAGGERVDADLVVANADTARVYGDLVPGSEAAASRRVLTRTQPSPSAFVVMLALRGRTSGLRAQTVLFAQDYDDEFDSVFATGRHRGRPRAVPDPAIHLSVPDDPALRPDDAHESMVVLVNAPRHAPSAARDGIDWDTPGFADAYADTVLALMAARGIDVRGRVLWRELRTPADIERETRSLGGSIYGTASNGLRAAFLRPANRSPVPGLFLVGGSAHPGGGLAPVGLGAAIVAAQIGPA